MELPYGTIPREQSSCSLYPHKHKAPKRAPCMCAGRENRGQLTTEKRFARASLTFLPGGSSPNSLAPVAHSSVFRFSTRAKQFARSTRTNTKRPKGRPVCVRVGRIELPSAPWQGAILPLNDTRVSDTVSFIILHPRTQPDLKRKWAYIPRYTQECKYLAHTTSQNSVPLTDTPCR